MSQLPTFDEKKSPLAKKEKEKESTWKQRLIFVGIGFVLSIMLIAWLWPTQHPNSMKQEVNTAEMKLALLQAPQLTQNAIKTPDIPTHHAPIDTDAQQLQKMRMVAPIQSFTQEVHQTHEQGTSNGANVQGDSHQQWMSSLEKTTTPRAKATRLLHPATTLTQGALISAILESSIISDLPGMVRAITRDDVYSEDGSTVLIPRGSRLIGQYTNAIARGQSRVFIVWQRLIRPDHIDIQLTSPSTDALGASGLGASHINHHFIEEFGMASLLSIIGAGAANLGVDANDNENSVANYREGIANSFSQSAAQTWQQHSGISPTITINQGALINVFVARDLDFNDALHSTLESEF